MTPFAVDVLGTTVALHAPDPVLAELRGLLVDLGLGAAPARVLELVEQPGGFTLLDDGTVLRAGVIPALAAATVVWRLNAIAASSPRHVVVHAGCVAGEAAVLLPGPSGTGKSTLTAACITAGMAYLSDELAALDPSTANVVPYPKPLGLGEDRLVAASDLRPGAPGTAGPPAGIVFPRYRAGAPLSVTPLRPSWTLLALAAHATNLAGRGGSALSWLAGLATSCPAWQVTYGEAHDAVRSVRDAASARVAPVRPAEVIGPITSATTTIVVGEELAVLDQPTGQVHLLNPGASAVWACVPEVGDRAELAHAALAAAPREALDHASVSATIDHLTRSGLLPPSWR